MQPIDISDKRSKLLPRAAVITRLARSADGGLIVTTSASVLAHRDLIITLAARHKLPAVYYARFYVTNGGLVSYGPDYVGQYRRAASYVDRILRGEKPADLPVQAPTKYQTCGLMLHSAGTARRGARYRSYVRFFLPLESAAALPDVLGPPLFSIIGI
jgi:ABC transporter substrate binding protein